MSQRVAGKVAIITGAASGIGAASARGLAREGASVVLTDIALAQVKLLAGQINQGGGTALALEHDVGVEKGWAAIIDATYDADDRDGGGRCFEMLQQGVPAREDQVGLRAHRITRHFCVMLGPSLAGVSLNVEV